MNTCQQCGEHHLLANQAEARFCPWCGAEQIGGDDPSQWTTLLRLDNAAEAGFLAEQLESAGINAGLAQQEEFSAVDGTWRMRHVLKVRHEDAMTAAEHIKQVVESPETTQARREAVAPESAEYDYDSSKDMVQKLTWWSWTSVVTVGVLLVGGAFVLQSVLPERREPVGDELLDTLRANGGPWHRERTQEGPALSFYFNEQEHVWVLDEHLNEDQIPERRRVYDDQELISDSRP